MVSVSQVIRQFRERWTSHLDEQVIEGICSKVGYRWRDRLLTPVMVRLFLLQISWGNTACDHLPRIAGRHFSGEAYCKARAKLPVAVLQQLPASLTAAMLKTIAADGL